MNAMQRIVGGAALALALAAGLSTPALAQKTPTTANTTVDFGDDSSQWANDGECDDPRFSGTGTADELVDEDILKDATDCQAAYDAGTVTFEGGTGPADIAIASPIDAINFGDDSSDWAKDGECDDPRFTGTGSATELADADYLRDATDCREAYQAGTVTLVDDDPETTVAAAPAVDFGDDSSEWANDGECDDPRFTGTGSATELLDDDMMADATDCQAAFTAGTVTLSDTYVDDGTTVSDTAETALTTLAQRIDFGDDTSEWANDQECDDPDFQGAGMAGELTPENIMADATDCRDAFIAGTIALGTGGSSSAADADVAAFDYGSDWSKYANDGECDDLRFAGEGASKKLMTEDMYGDATDCRALEAEGRVSIRTIYTPEYAAGAPYDSSDVDFGDNASSYADDDQCDDPRFEGPGAASTLLDSDLQHDSADCKAAYEAGTVMLSDGV